jgi:two-component system, NarL family, nitrate/nitrite response regulator NarL
MTPLGHFTPRNHLIHSLVPVTQPNSGLTPKEKEVLKYIGQGKTSKQIAIALNLSVFTVSNHRRHICKKFGLHSTAQLVAFAVNHGQLKAKPAAQDETAASE